MGGEGCFCSSLFCPIFTVKWKCRNEQPRNLKIFSETQTFSNWEVQPVDSWTHTSTPVHGCHKPTVLQKCVTSLKLRHSFQPSMKAEPHNSRSYHGRPPSFVMPGRDIWRPLSHGVFNIYGSIFQSPRSCMRGDCKSGGSCEDVYVAIDDFWHTFLRDKQR